MNRLALILAFFLLPFTLGTPLARQADQPPGIPARARLQLDAILPGWKLTESTGSDLSQRPQPAWACFINSDSLADYALDVTFGEGDQLKEYFVALVSTDTGYTAHILKSFSVGAGLGEYDLTIIRRGEKVSNYGFVDDPSSLCEAGTNIYPSDLPTIVHKVRHACLSFLYRGGVIRPFQSCP